MTDFGAPASSVESRNSQKKKKNGDDGNDSSLSSSSSSSLFQDFARTVCQANSIPRKELYETWATALYIQETFPNCHRIADLACGHGLLSWALLLLDEELHNSNDDDDNNNNRKRRSAICIDKRMPTSAEKLATVMLEKYPQFTNRWDYVEGKLDSIIIQQQQQEERTATSSSSSSSQSTTTTRSTMDAAAASTTTGTTLLLCGIHACGLLSDRIISLAIEGNIPFVLVPCCYTKKSLNDSKRKIYDEINNSTSSRLPPEVFNNNNNDTDPTESSLSLLSQFVNQQRMERLSMAGFNVQQTSIPKEFTPQNTVLLASPPLTPPTPPTPPTSAATRRSFVGTSTSTTSTTKMHNNNNNNNGSGIPRRRNQPPFSLPPISPIPIDDSRESRTIVRQMAGREAANHRKQQQQQSCRSRSFCLSLDMPQEDSVTTASLLSFTTTTINLAVPSLRQQQQQQQQQNQKQQENDNNKNVDNVTTTNTSKSIIKVEYADSEAFFHTKIKRYFRTFRITYDYHDGDGDDNDIDETHTTTSTATTKSTTTMKEEEEKKKKKEKEKVKELHARICTEIPYWYPGCWVRS